MKIEIFQVGKSISTLYNVIKIIVYYQKIIFQVALEGYKRISNCFLPSSNSTVIVKTNERENEKNLHLSFENNRGLFVVLSEKIAAEVAVELLGT